MGHVRESLVIILVARVLAMTYLLKLCISFNASINMSILSSLILRYTFSKTVPNPFTKYTWETAIYIGYKEQKNNENIPNRLNGLLIVP